MNSQNSVMIDWFAIFFSLITFNESLPGLGWFCAIDPVRGKIFVGSQGKWRSAEETLNESGRSDHKIVRQCERRGGKEGAEKVSNFKP